MTPEPTRDASSAAAASATTAAGGVDAPTAALYHMSRTAGVGLGDYAAVNVRAVIGLLLGLASVLAYIFADSLLPLMIPVAALIVSGIALVQIQNSNGTQTGRGIAIGGVVLALLLGGLTVRKQVATATAQRDARVELADLVKQFSDASAKQDAKAAYGLFAASFREQVRFESFERTLVSRATGIFGPGVPIDRFELGPRVNYEWSTGGKLVSATTLLVILGNGTRQDGQPARYEVPTQFIVENGDWKIQDISNYFIQQDRNAAGSGGAAGR